MRKHFVRSYKFVKSKIISHLIEGFSFINKRFSKRKNFSSQTQSTIMNARMEALSRGNNYIGLEHLLLSIIKLTKGRAIEILENLNCNVARLKQDIEKEIVKLPKGDKSYNSPLTKQVENVLKIASIIADEFKSKEIENEHLLLAILKEDSSLLAPILQRFNITYDNYYAQLRKLQSD